jgi:DNA-3-methyladenine glycosylase I
LIVRIHISKIEIKGVMCDMSLKDSLDTHIRCFGSKPGHDLYAHYHDNEWGIPIYDDKKLFEFLVLEGAQAGLSWETILKKRNGYRDAYHQFDPIKVAAMTDAELETLRDNPNIIRNRLKIYAARRNARVFLTLQSKHGSFSRYLWDFVQGTPIINEWKTLSDIPCLTPLSTTVSQDLAQHGMTFVGPKIIYAYMQAVGLVNDHLTTCWRYQGKQTPSVIQSGDKS